MNKRFTLKIKIDVCDVWGELIDPVFVIRFFDLSGFAGKHFKSAGALGAAEVAGRRGFDADADGQSPVDGVLEPFAVVITEINECEIRHLPKRKFGDVVPVVGAAWGHRGQMYLRLATHFFFTAETQRHRGSTESSNRHRVN